MSDCSSSEQRSDTVEIIQSGSRPGIAGLADPPFGSRQAGWHSEAGDGCQALNFDTVLPSLPADISRLVMAIAAEAMRQAEWGKDPYLTLPPNPDLQLSSWGSKSVSTRWKQPHKLVASRRGHL